MSKRFDIEARLPPWNERMKPTYRFSATGQYSSQDRNNREEAVKK